VRLKKAGMGITLNGIAQGFAADRAMGAIKGCGVRHALVNAGEIASLGRKAGGELWSVGIQHPRVADAYLGLAQLEGRCMSTSGDYETTFSVDKAYNHIFEPWSGRSPEAFSSVTVVAPSATEADALSTAIFVLGMEKGMELVRASAGVDVLLVGKDGREMASGGFPWRRG
jgi:FAD:protein FMN transferase